MISEKFIEFLLSFKFVVVIFIENKLQFDSFAVIVLFVRGREREKTTISLKRCHWKSFTLKIGIIKENYTHFSVRVEVSTIWTMHVEKQQILKRAHIRKKKSWKQRKNHRTPHIMQRFSVLFHFFRSISFLAFLNRILLLKVDKFQFQFLDSSVRTMVCLFVWLLLKQCEHS